MILRQNDYSVYPPKTNNFMRPEDKNWRGIKKVKLDLLDAHGKAFKNEEQSIEKPLIEYGSNTSQNTNFNFFGANHLIVEGTYTSTLSNVDISIFID